MRKEKKSKRHFDGSTIITWDAFSLMKPVAFISTKMISEEYKEVFKKPPNVVDMSGEKMDFPTGKFPNSQELAYKNLV